MNDKVKNTASDEMNLPAVTDQQAAIMTPESNLIFDSGKFAQLERIADIMASGTCTVPKHLHGNKGDCFAVAMQAAMWGMNPYAVSQKTHLVNGVLGYEAQLVGAAIKSSHAIKGIVHHEYFGPWENIIDKQTAGKRTWTDADEKGCGVKVWAIPAGQDTAEYHELRMTQVATRNSPLWTANPQLQLFYLAEKQWARKYTPGAILGVYTPDELEEKEPMKNITPAQEIKGGASVEDLKSKLGLKTAAELVNEEPPLSKLVQDVITGSGAPITMEDVTAYLATKGIVTGIDELKTSANEKIAKWDKHIRCYTDQFVKTAAEWVTARA